MLRKNPTGHSPQVSTKAFIDPTAVICGRVIIEDYVYVGPYAVIRADEVNADGMSCALALFTVIIHSTDCGNATVSVAHQANRQASSKSSRGRRP